MKTFYISIGDKVKLYNGTTGSITNIDPVYYLINIDNRGWYHKLDIKYLNDELVTDYDEIKLKGYE